MSNACGADSRPVPAHFVVPRLTWEQSCGRRLARHGLARPLRSGVADVVGTMCGAHAQVMAAAEVSVALRLDGATRADVAEALWVERSLVKTFGPRGTVHLLPTRDLAMWTGALSALPTRNGLPERDRLTIEQTEEVVEVLAGALRDTERTVDELDHVVIERCGSWAGDLVVPAFGDFAPRWRQAVSVAAHRGVLCFGPNRGRKLTYTSPLRELPDFCPAPATEALASLVHRYLHAYGPATPAHLAQWLAVPAGWAAELFTSLGPRIELVDLDGSPAWVNAGDIATEVRQSALRLLPYFDAFTVASQPRERLFPGLAAGRALSRGQAGNYPVMLIGCTVAGVWHSRRSGRRLAVTVEPFARLAAVRRRELEREVDRLAAILDTTADLTVGSVAAGAHA